MGKILRKGFDLMENNFLGQNSESELILLKIVFFTKCHT